MTSATYDSRAEWAERVRLYGPHRAVLNVKNGTPEREAAFFRTQEDVVSRLLARQLVASDHMALDFGCGTGRWTPILANMVGRCVGIDITPEILSVAMACAGWDVIFREYAGTIPAGRNDFDVVFSCLVLNAILDDEALSETISDMARVLRPGGLVFIVDVTQRSNVRTRWSVLRSVEEYRAAFACVAPLQLLGEYLDLGETHSIMAGRKPL